jgi:hypothetical protein
VSAGTITVGDWANRPKCHGEGTLSVLNGAVKASGNLVVGVSGSKGKLSFEGGTMTVDGDAYIGRNGGSGSVDLGGATMTVMGSAYIGRNAIIDQKTGKEIEAPGTGDVYVLGGQLNVDSSLYIENGSNLTLSGSSTVKGKVALSSTAPRAVAGVATLGIYDGSMTVNSAVGVSIGENSRVTVGANATLKADRVDVSNNTKPVGSATLTINNGGTVKGAVIVHTGGLLNGTKGKKGVTGDVKVNGGDVVLAPGPLDVGGSYVQTSDSTLQIELDGLDSFATVDVAGKGAFSAGSSLAFDFAGFRPTVGESITFFDALGGVQRGAQRRQLRERRV